MFLSIFFSATRQFSQSSLNRLASVELEDNDFQENTHSAAAYALSTSSYQSGGYGFSSYSGGGGGGSAAGNGTQMVVKHGKRVKSSLRRLQEQQDELFQL